MDIKIPNWGCRNEEEEKEEEFFSGKVVGGGLSEDMGLEDN